MSNLFELIDTKSHNREKEKIREKFVENLEIRGVSERPRFSKDDRKRYFNKI